MSQVIGAGAGGGITTITGDIGGAVGPSGAGNVILAGAGGIVITGNPGANTLTITSAGGGFTWNEELGVAVNMAVANAYIMNNVGQVTGTLPAIAALGDTILVYGKGAGGWKVAQNAGQTIFFDAATATTTGVGGSVDSNDDFDVLQIVCITANTDFTGVILNGNVTVN